MNVNILVVRLSYIIRDEQVYSRIYSPEWPRQLRTAPPNFYSLGFNLLSFF
jgi:hypothetical protein